MLSKMSKTLSILGAMAMALLTVGCSEEGDENSSPTPTPTPTPSPTPTPFPTPTPTPTPTPSAAATSDEVVLTNANMVAAAAEDSAAELRAAGEALSIQEPTAEDLTRAQLLLARAREAFSLVETSLFYTYPQNPDEQAALPPTLATRQPSLTIPGFDDLAAQLSGRLSGEDSPSNPELLESVKSLLAELDILDTSWTSDSTGNFRNAIFLRDEDAPARILQGLVSTTDFLILASALPEKHFQIPTRLRTLKKILDGKSENLHGRVISGHGLLSLIAKTDQIGAQRIQQNLDALIFPYDQPGADPLPASAFFFETLRNDFLEAARRMGYKIETLPNLPDAE